MNSKIRETLNKLIGHDDGVEFGNGYHDECKAEIDKAEQAILALFESYASEREREAVLNWWRGRIIPHANDGTVKLEHFTAELAALKADTQEQSKGEV